MEIGLREDMDIMLVIKKITTLAIGLVIVTAGTSVYASDGSISLNVFQKPLRLMFDGKEKVSENQPFLYDGTTYVPLRFMSESMGIPVEWDETNQTIWVGDKPFEPEKKYLGEPENKWKWLSTLLPVEITGDASRAFSQDKWSEKGTRIRPDSDILLTNGSGFSSIGVELPTAGSGKVIYQLGGQYSSFSGMFCFDSRDMNNASTGKLEVYANGVRIYESVPVKARYSPIPVNLYLRGVDKLEFKFTTQGSEPVNLVVGNATMYLAKRVDLTDRKYKLLERTFGAVGALSTYEAKLSSERTSKMIRSLSAEIPIAPPNTTYIGMDWKTKYTSPWTTVGTFKDGNGEVSASFVNMEGHSAYKRTKDQWRDSNLLVGNPYSVGVFDAREMGRFFHAMSDYVRVEEDAMHYWYILSLNSLNYGEFSLMLADEVLSKKNLQLKDGNVRLGVDKETFLPVQMMAQLNYDTNFDREHTERSRSFNVEYFNHGGDLKLEFAPEALAILK
jgi:hypothetical protein